MSEIIRAEHWTKIDLNDWKWKNFTPMEIACRGTGTLIIPVDFMNQLQIIRDHLKQPMHVMSGCRTVQYNKGLELRGYKPAKTSFHICDSDLGRGQDGCLAVDIATTEGSYRGRLFELAWSLGFSIGWNAKRGFLHLDRRVDVGWKQSTFDY